MAGQQAKVTISAELANNYVQAFDKAIARANELQKRLGKLGAAQKAMANAANRAEKEVREQGQASEKASVQVKKYSQSTKIAQNNTNGLITKVAGLAAAYLSVQTAIGFVSASLQLAGEFSTQIATAGAVSGATAQELEDLTNIAREMGATTEFTASQAAEGLVILGRAGVQAAEQVALMPKVLDLATASGTSLAEASDILLSTLNQFDKPITEATHVMDVLTKTANTSKNTLGTIGEAMKYLGPTSKALGMSLEETSAIIGIMADNGLVGSLGTRALGTAMTRLAKPTKKMQEVINQYNIELFKSNGEMKGYAEIIKELETRLAGLNPKQKNAAINTLFASEAFQELTILLTKGSDAVSEYTQRLSDSGNETKRTAALIRASLGNQLKELKSATEDFQLEFIKALGDTMPALIKAATESMRSFSAALKDPEVQLALQNMVNLLTSVVKLAASITNFGIDIGGAIFGNNSLANMGVGMSNAVASIYTPLPQSNSGGGGGGVSISSPVTVNIPSSVSGNVGADSSSIASAVRFAMGQRNEELVSQVKRSTQL